MAYWRLFFHFVWATKDRQPLISPQIETLTYNTIIGKAQEKQARVYAVNGTTDHVHLVVSVPPTIALSSFVQHIKGASSYIVSAEYDMYFGWQDGYGVFSLSERALDAAVEYVRKQKEHHAMGIGIVDDLERIEE